MTISAFSFISIMRWALVGGGGCNRTKMHLINPLAADLFELGRMQLRGGELLHTEMELSSMQPPAV